MSHPHPLSKLPRALAALSVAAAMALPVLAQEAAPVAPSASAGQAAAPAPDAKGARQLAPGFTALPQDAKIAILPVDIELLEIGIGGPATPKADWTAQARSLMNASLVNRASAQGIKAELVSADVADEFGEHIALHAAVAQSIASHHAFGTIGGLPTKQGALNWSFGSSFQPLQARTGARYGLFVFVRDTYSSAERKAAMVALALLGVGISGGVQVGYASLVDFQTGQVLWFNGLASGFGDLREKEPAEASIGALLQAFPATQRGAS